MSRETQSLLTANEMAQRIQKDVSWVAYLCREGRLPGAFKVNPQAHNSPWLIPVATVEAYEREHAKKHD